MSLVFRVTNLFTAAASVCGVTLEPTRPTPPLRSSEPYGVWIPSSPRLREHLLGRCGLAVSPHLDARTARTRGCARIHLRHLQPFVGEQEMFPQIANSTGYTVPRMAWLG